MLTGGVRRLRGGGVTVSAGGLSVAGRRRRRSSDGVGRGRGRGEAMASAALGLGRAQVGRRQRSIILAPRVSLVRQQQSAVRQIKVLSKSNTHTRTRLTALFPVLPGWAGTRKVKPIWILLKQETVRGSGISWAVCKSAPRSRQITMPAPHHSVFYRPDALPAAQPTASKH